MRYTIVSARRDGDNREYGAVYYGITDINEALTRFLEEFPKYKGGDWLLSTSVSNY